MFNVIPHIFAVALTVYFHYLLIPAAKNVHLTDKPTERKAHVGEIPLVGGVAMFLGIMFPVFVMDLPPGSVKEIILGMAMLVITGVLDDLRDLRPRSKFFVQILAALVMTAWAGVYLGDIGDLLGTGDIELGNWAIPFTVICVVGVINAINMIDGIDGLAGTQSLITFVLLFLLALQAGAVVEAKILLLFIAAVVGFLGYNLRLPGRSRALAFMGDSGSMILGFGLAWFLVSLSQGENRAYSPVTALWIFAVPLFDMFGIMVRRMLKGQSPFRPDRQHLHHMFQTLGLSVNQSVLILGVVSLAFAIAGISMDMLGVPEWVMFFGYLLLFGIYVWVLRHAWIVLKYFKRTFGVAERH